MTLLVRPSKAYLTHNTNYFTSMDPYCYLYLGKQAQKTTPHYGGGLKPEWKQVMKFKVDNIAKLGIEIWTKALIGNDTLIGQGLLDLSKLHLSKGGVVQEYADVFFNNKPAGRVLLELQYFAPQTHHHQNQKKVQQKVENNGWDIGVKPERKSWAGEVNWRGSNASNNVPAYQPQSAIYVAEGGSYKNKTTSEIKDNPYGLQEPALNKDFHKQKTPKAKTEQDSATQYLNQQILQNFALKLSNVDAKNVQPQKPQSVNQSYQEQQILYEQMKIKQLQQKKLEEQYKQQYQMNQSPFQNLNNLKPSTGLTPGTVYAKPDKHYNPERGSNVGQKSNIGRQSNVGIGSTPPKSILTPPKHNKPKSPGKKVHFVDQP